MTLQQELHAASTAMATQVPAQNDVLSERHQLGFPLLSDAGNQIGSRYNVVYTLPNFLRPLFVSMGADLESFNGDSSFTLPLAATFIIDRQGTIRFSFVDLDPAKRAEPGDLLATLATMHVP